MGIIPALRCPSQFSKIHDNICDREQKLKAKQYVTCELSLDILTLFKYLGAYQRDDGNQSGPGNEKYMHFYHLSAAMLAEQLSKLNREFMERLAGLALIVISASAFELRAWYNSMMR